MYCPIKTSSMQYCFIFSKITSGSFLWSSLSNSIPSVTSYASEPMPWAAWKPSVPDFLFGFSGSLIWAEFRNLTTLDLIIATWREDFHCLNPTWKRYIHRNSYLRGLCTWRILRRSAATFSLMWHRHNAEISTRVRRLYFTKLTKFALSKATSHSTMWVSFFAAT